MKIPVLLLLLSAAVFSAPAQKTKTPSTYDIALNVYHSALLYNDYTAARSAVYELMTLRPEEKTWNDTLVILFFSGGMYEQSVYLGRELLQNKPEDMILLEIVAISEENLGMIKESLADYEKLFPLSEKLLHHYKIATLQYALKRFGECGQNLNTLISNPASANEKITINLGQGQAQEVFLLAALWNVAGMIALETGQEEEARKCFGKSLEADPQFVLPQNNLAYIDAKKQEQK